MIIEVEVISPISVDVSGNGPLVEEIVLVEVGPVGPPGAQGLQGVQGVQGVQGLTGPTGPAGQGVPAGGSTGQVLKKLSGASYDTAWQTDLNSGVWGSITGTLSSQTDLQTALNLKANTADALLKAGNLSGLTNVTTARSNLGLGPTVAQVFAGVSGVSGSQQPDQTYITYSVGYSGYSRSIQHRTSNTAEEGMGDNSYIDYVNSTSLSDSALTFSTSTYSNAETLATEKTLSLNASSLSLAMSDGVASLGLSPVNGLVVNDGSSGMSYTPSGIAFPDSTVQTTAAVTFDPTGYATESWVTSQGYAPLDAPVFTGDAQAVTAALGDNDTSIATTAFVQQELLSGTANARNLEVYVRNQTGSTIPAGSIVYINGATGNRPTITLAQANNDTNSAQTIGFTKTAIANNGFGFVIVRGELENINTSALTEGVQLYLSPTTAGTWTTTKPSAPQHLVYVGVVIRSHPTLGTILVSVQNGYELNELHDVALSSLANNDLLVYELSTDLWKNKSFSTLGLATLASPTFTGTPSLPTGTTAVTQTAGNNTTALATTAFVTAAVPAFATDAQAIAGTSATTIINPADYRVAGLTTNIWAPGVSGLSALSAGTGSNTGSSITALSGRLVAPNASTAGYATRGFLFFYPSNTAGSNYNYSTPSGHSVRYYSNYWGSNVAGVKIRSVFGRMSNTAPVPATLANRGYGWEFDQSNRTMNIIAHNGTTLTTTAVTWNPVASRTYEITATSDGAGTISLYVDGTLLGTSSGGPTGTAPSPSQLWWQTEIQNEATAAAQLDIFFQNPKVFTTNG